MISQHYNHPSVILWGLGNENDWECDFDYFDQEEIRSFMKELHDLSHQLDAGRLTAIRRCEFCKDIIDVYSPSIWAGWYRGIYTDYEKSSRMAFEQVDSFFHMEWGADNLPTRHVEKTYTGFEFIPRGNGATEERDGDYLVIAEKEDIIVKDEPGRAGIYVDPLGGNAAAIGETVFISAGGPAMAAVKAGMVTHLPTSVVSAKCEGLATAFITLQ